MNEKQSVNATDGIINAIVSGKLWESPMGSGSRPQVSHPCVGKENLQLL